MAKSRTPSAPAKKAAPGEPAALTDRANAEYTVVARRYRPQQFAELVGQEHVARALANALTSGRVAHAYLFTGPRGVGKTSAARILAKALNCVNGPTATPCDACDICQSIVAGDDVDVVEIDAASHTGVDNIRELRQNVGFRPQRSRNKVYIIDEIHMLSKGAFNALLKTLEEPPPNVKFIFATTEVQKLPITILSRCQRFDFATIGPAKVFETLKQIVAREGLKADDDALQLIARRAAGSMRDAQTLLDQLLGFVPDGHVTAAAVHALLGTAGDDRVAELAAAILAGDVRTAVEQVSLAADRGLQLGELLDQLVDYWRGLMLVIVAGPDAPDLPGTPALQEAIRLQAAGRNLDTILSGLDILTSAKSKSRGSLHVQVLTEVAVIRLARMDELLSVAQLAQHLEEGTLSAVPRGEERSQSDVAVRDGLPGKTPTQNGAGAPKKNARNEPDGSVNGQETPEIPGSADDDPFVAIWSRVLQELGPMLRAHLQALEFPAIIGPNTLAIRVPSDYSAAYDALASESGQTAIRQALRRQSREDWSVRVERTGEPSGAGRPAVTPPAAGTERKLDLQRLPIFRRAQEVLGAQLVRIEDGFNPTPARPADWTETDATTETPEPGED